MNAGRPARKAEVREYTDTQTDVRKREKQLKDRGKEEGVKVEVVETRVERQ